MYDLKDVTFVIPYKCDHNDRYENLDIVLSWIRDNFDTNVLVGEQDGITNPDFFREHKSDHLPMDMEFFHRTRMLNIMYERARTNIIFNHDADVILPPKAIKEAVDFLRGGESFVYPYSGAFVHVPRELTRRPLENLYTIALKGYDDHSVGGCVGFLKDKYLAIGGENEHYITHAPEDRDRERRFILFGGYKRLPYPLFHLDHYVGEDSNYLNQWHDANFREFYYVMSLDKEGMENYIKSWPWVNT